MIEFILRILQDVHPRSYYRVVDDEGILPYAVFDYPQTDTEESRKDYTVSIQLWGNDSTLRQLDEIVTALEQLDRRRYDEPDMFVWVSHIVTLPIEDPNPHLARREVRLQLHTYHKEV